MRDKILFISTMAGLPWGASEELWTRTAIWLVKQRIPVAASVHGWHQLDPRISNLLRVGVDLRPRPVERSLITRLRQYLSGKAQFVVDIEKSLKGISPSLVVISNGATFPPIELLEMCIERGWRFATIAHTNPPTWWPSDEMAARFRKALPLAERCYFVSEANRTLAEKQLGYDFENAEIVRNPLNVQTASKMSWPSCKIDDELRMACVGRLSGEKGLDIILDVLAEPQWEERRWRLTLYGSGPLRNVLERLVKRAKLDERVSFAGYVAVEKIWSENHILVMPSRFEGMPLAVIEAMFCGRPVVATNVGGISEVITDNRTGFLADAAVPECFGTSLERMWTQRYRLEDIGKQAEADIRELMPNNPIQIFAEKLKDLTHL
jgi:glycosyltransferase involved in cell wall biosynthesis